MNAEEQRIQEPGWKKWGPYLSERQWGTVREDYSANGDAWNYFTHDDARSRVYRWGEDGIAGISDDQQHICFAVALWNGKDPILKERLFGLNGFEGNHGEDVKELYYYLDNTPSHAYMKHLYKYPQASFPYAGLLNTNRNRNKEEREYEITDTGIFNDGKYFDVITEYAKADIEDICIRLTISNRGSETAFIAVLPTLWFRNLWSFGLMHEKPNMYLKDPNPDFGELKVDHYWEGAYHFYFENSMRNLFTENETNKEKLFGEPNDTPYVKDAFHTAVTSNDFTFLGEKKQGTKFSPMYEFNIEGKSSVTVKLRLSKHHVKGKPFDGSFDEAFSGRLNEADEFYKDITKAATADQLNIQRQAFAGMLWSKQYYNIDIPKWLHGDKGQPVPPKIRKKGRNHQWHTLNNEDIISMPDKWEYPWYATWDLAFHCIPLAMIDPRFAKDQLILLLREWYMHPNGQLPAYEWDFSNVNPPLHGWSCFHVYKIDKEKTGNGDIDFLKRVFQKLLINFTWWVNRKDEKGNNVFEGGFLGMDNIALFDRSDDMPPGYLLEQADGTSWMAMYCLNMLEMALEISQYDATYEDVATKFLEHFVYITESLNKMGVDWVGAWDEEDGFFYDVLEKPGGNYVPLKVRSLVGLTSLFAVFVLKKELLDKVPDFHKRLKWFQKYREENNRYNVIEQDLEDGDILLSLVSKVKLEKLLKALLDENEFLSDAGIRSVSKVYETPYQINIDGKEFRLDYQPGEATTSLFGGNSNWRGPVWMPMNYLIVQALQRYGDYYGEDCLIEYPTGSGAKIKIDEIAQMIAKKLVGIFEKDETGKRKVNGTDSFYQTDEYFKELVLFYEYYHGDNARGVGASHQTGWTGVVAELINRINKK